MTEETLDLSPLEQVFEEFQAQKGALIPVLQRAQEIFGYLPREVLETISQRMGVALSQVYGVATFYAQFRLKPVGKHKVTACCGTACHVRGAERIISGIERELRLDENEDTTRDGEITFEKVACLGFCSFAPIVLVDGSVHGKATTDTVLKEIKTLRKP